MMTCSEYLELFDRAPEEIHVHGLDLLNHCLQGDTEKTWYKDRDPQKRMMYELQEEMEKHAQNDELNKVLEDKLTQKDKWIRFDSIDGELDVDRFIENQNNGNFDIPMFDEYRKEKRPKPAMTLILDCAIPYMERSRPDMAKRHREVYTLAVQAFMEGRPCRVIAVFAVRYREDTKARRIFITIKDFNEPIFSGMWGAFKSNRATNSFLNVIMDYFIGTHSSGNGTPEDTQITNYIPREECELIDPKRLYY